MALRGWCSVDSALVHEVLSKSGHNDLFCSTNDTDLAKVNVPISMGYEDPMRLCGTMGPIALGLRTTPKGFSVWWLRKNEPEVRAYIDPELFRSIHPRYDDMDVNALPLYNITGAPSDIHVPDLFQILADSIDWQVAVGSREGRIYRGKEVAKGTYNIKVRADADPPKWIVGVAIGRGVVKTINIDAWGDRLQSKPGPLS